MRMDTTQLNVDSSLDRHRTGRHDLIQLWRSETESAHARLRSWQSEPRHDGQTTMAHTSRMQVEHMSPIEHEPIARSQRSDSRFFVGQRMDFMVESTHP